ncbi:MAG: ABC transporter ATP-binding protein [Leucobacter sp.]
MTLHTLPFSASRGHNFKLSVPALEFRPGEIFGLLGPNGAGKSTLLHSLAGHLPESHRAVSWGGVSRARLGQREWARRVAFVAQDSAAPSDLSIRQFVQLGRVPFTGWLRPTTRTDRYVVDHALERCGLESIQHTPIDRLSGGQHQRAKIARALAQEPRALLLDEPTNHLDLAAIRDTVELLRTLASTSVALIVSLHDLDLASVFTDRAAIVSCGSIVAAGPTGSVVTPAMIQNHWGVDMIHTSDGSRSRYLLRHDFPPRTSQATEAAQLTGTRDDPPAALRAPIEPMEALT